ncbi:MAG: DUF4367 domain-containing protein, partial [Desulfotomaculaceae bacterium]|nr:DUF4367 domain-containing protein [Desulfotomaculaceae bacterium]
RNTLRTRLSILLKTPAAVASLFFVVLVTGFLTFNSYFNPAKQQNVAFSDKDKGQYSGSAVLPAGNKAGAAVEEVGSLKERQLQQTDSVKNLNEQMNREPDNTVKEPAPDQPVIMAEILRDQLPAPADNAAPERLNKPRSVEEQRTAAVTSAPPDAGTGMAATNDEALEAAPRYMDFTPAKPDYLPRGSILVNISRLADEISQDYRTGDNYFTVSQSRLEADDFAFVEKTAQVANVKINGWQGFIEESRPKPGDHVSGAVTTLKWRQGEWAFSVSGDLPPEEIIRISASIK